MSLDHEIEVLKKKLAGSSHADEIRKQLSLLAVKAKAESADPTLAPLGEEVSVWIEKLDVILGEPVAKQGLLKHLNHWLEILHRKKISS